jgi:predicted Zn-ribbon and HTH transcriptional regulator
MKIPIKDRPIIPRGYGYILHHCQRCGYDWSSFLERPSRCSRCTNRQWDIPLFPCECLRCKHQWNAQTMRPAKCPKCTHFLWYEPRKDSSRDVFDKLLLQETEDCVGWPLSVIRDGYGRLRVGKKTVQTHRLAYAKRIGPISDGEVVCHKCDNPTCMNYRHLFLGTPNDNNQDRMAKKRHVFGENHPLAKLTEDQVLEIRSKYVRDLKNRAQRQLFLAREYGVDQGVISAIIRRKTWKHI